MTWGMVVDVSSFLPDDDLRAITSIACEAARLVVAMRNQGLRVQHKEDGSPRHRCRHRRSTTD